MDLLKESNLRLTEKYFSHAKGCYYWDWDENLMRAMLGSRPTYDNGVISFSFMVKRCFYSVLFSKKTGFYLGMCQYFKNTKTEMSEYALPLIEFITSMSNNGYLEFVDNGLLQ